MKKLLLIGLMALLTVGAQAKDIAGQGVAQLIAPGNAVSFNTGFYSLITVFYTIASIDTSLDVRLEGTGDGTNWTNMAVDGLDTTITQNGTYGFSFSTPIQVRKVRLVFVSETGGTGATIDTYYVAGNT